MKTILMITICLLWAGIANAQKNLLALDEHNNYIYYQVVDLPGASADSLYKNVMGFVGSAFPKIKLKQAANSPVNIQDKFLVYNVALVKHESGEITYVLNIECKDGKYRYWLTEFVFTPYERNRYGAFVAVNGAGTPLEYGMTKLSKKDLDGYLDQTGAFCKQLGEKLKLYMSGVHETKKTDKQPAKIVTDKW